MDYRLLFYFCLTATCVVVGGLSTQHVKRLEQYTVATPGTAFQQNCEASGIETEAGYVGCLQQVSFGYVKSDLRVVNGVYARDDLSAYLGSANIAARAVLVPQFLLTLRIELVWQGAILT